MELYRARVQHWREVDKLGLTLMDVTVKSGLKQFAPDRDALYKYKASKKTVDDVAVFELLFMEKMNNLWRVAPEEFDILVNQKTLVLGCYCDQESKDYCHLDSLCYCIEKICNDRRIPFKYKGVIKK